MDEAEAALADVRAEADAANTEAERQRDEINGQLEYVASKRSVCILLFVWFLVVFIDILKNFF